MKKNWSSILILILIFLLLFVPSFKVLVIKGFLATGFFNTEIQSNKKSSTSLTSTDWQTTFLNDKNSPVSLNSLKGKVIFINFWATWCAPCLAEMPDLNAFHNEFKNDTRLAFLTVEMDANRDGALQLFSKKQWNMPLYFPQSNIPTKFYSGTLPTTLIIDAYGTIVFKKEGFAQYHNPEFIQQIKELL